MELKEVQILLQKFFDGQTSVEEEEKLDSFFAREDIPEELADYKEFFSAKEELANTQFIGFEDEVMDHILESEHQEKNKYRWLWQTVTSVAAVLVVAIMVINFSQSDNQIEDTYDNPEIAYEQAAKTLQYIAGKYQKGLAQLQPISKINEAPKPMKKGISMVNKGFGAVNELEKIHNELKN